MPSVLVALVALLLLAIVRAESNVTIDDMDSRVMYQPPEAWSFQGNSVNTQDRLNKTTHYTTVLGATASLTFTGALHVYCIGYAMKGGSSPLLVPITLQPWNGDAITVQSDASRPTDADAVITLFSSEKLDPSETYTITVTKTSTTLGNDLNVDAFILTQLHEVATTSSSPAQTTAIGGSNITAGPIISLGVLDATTLTSASPAENTSIASADNSSGSVPTRLIAGAIAGGVIGGLAIGIIITLLLFRWWSKRDQPEQWLVGSDATPSPPHVHNTPRPTYFDAVPWYPSEHTDALPQAPTDHQSVPSTLPGNPLTLGPGQRMAQVDQTLSFTPLMRGKTQYVGNNRPDHEVLTSSPTAHSTFPSTESTEPRDATPPAYS